MKMRISTLALLTACSVVSVEASCKRHLNAGWDVGGAGGGVGGQGGGEGGQGAGTVCVPGETRSCYDGPEGTENKGICKAGVETCFPDGSSWFSCSGAVKPAVENCATLDDDDCDGDAPKCIGEHQWSKRAGDGSIQRGKSIVTDSMGSVIVVGDMYGSVDFGAGPMTSAGGSDVFIAKLDSMGTQLWAKRFGADQDQSMGDVAVDAAGNVLAIGSYRGSMDFGGAALVSAGGGDIFVAKLDPTGAYLWAKSFGDAQYQAGSGVAVDGDGNVIMVGNFQGSLDFGGGPLSSAGGTDIFVTKLNAAGAYVWSKKFGDVENQNVADIAVDQQGNIFVTGYFSGTIDFGGGPLVSAEAADIFIAKLDSAGALLWAKSFGDQDNQRAYCITVDNQGDVIVAGSFSGKLDFGGGAMVSAGLGDGFIAKIDSMGTYRWAKSFGDAQYQSAFGVVADTVGNIILTGELHGEANLGNNNTLSALGADVFVTKLDTHGNYLWGRRFGDAQDQVGTAIAVDDSNDVFITGFFYGAVDFGGNMLLSAGEQDIFIAKLGQ